MRNSIQPDNDRMQISDTFKGDRVA